MDITYVIETDVQNGMDSTYVIETDVLIVMTLLKPWQKVLRVRYSGQSH